MNVTRIATRRPAWVDHAECRGASAAVFFPERGESVNERSALRRTRHQSSVA